MLLLTGIIDLILCPVKLVLYLMKAVLLEMFRLEKNTRL